MSAVVETAPAAQPAEPGRERVTDPRRRRRRLVTLGAGVCALALFVITLGIGSTYVAPWDVLASVLHLRDVPLVDFVVRELRLPAAVTGLTVGFALGLSGPLFQRMLANPLAAPDFVGISSGAGLFAASAMIVFHASGLVVSGAALVGAAVSTALVYLLAWRDGIQGFRFILIGIGIAAFMESLIGYVLARATIWDARAAMTWLIGSVGQAGPTELRVLVVVVLVVTPFALLLDRQLGALELGDDAATALGNRVEPSRLAIVLVVVVLVGCATAAAGPIGFVALMAGPIVARLSGSSGSLLASGFVGSSIVLGADLVALHVMPKPVATGVVTGVVGAVFLLWLLIGVNREGRGG